MSSAICIQEEGDSILLVIESCNSAASVFARLLQAREQQDCSKKPFLSALMAMRTNGYASDRAGGNDSYLCKLLFPSEWIQYQRESEKNPSLKTITTVDVDKGRMCVEFGHAAYPDRIGVLEVPLHGALDLLKRMTGLGLGNPDAYFTSRSERFEQELAGRFPAAGTNWLSTSARSLVDTAGKKEPTLETAPTQANCTLTVSRDTVLFLKDIIKKMEAFPENFAKLFGRMPKGLGDLAESLKDEAAQAEPVITKAVQHGRNLMRAEFGTEMER